MENSEVKYHRPQRERKTKLMFSPRDKMVSGNKRSLLSLARLEEIDSLSLPLSKKLAVRLTEQP